jgi:hypothetical protein
MQQTQIATAAQRAMGGFTAPEDGKRRSLIVRDEQGNWSVLDVDKDGNQKTKGNLSHIAPIDPMTSRESVFFFLGLAKEAPNKRIAAVSLMADILKEQGSRVDAWKGKGDPKKGLDNDLKGAFQKCEDKFFEKYMDKGHPDHKQFVRSLPTADGRGNPLELEGKLVPEKQYEAFLTNTRKDPSYANAKNLVLSYFSLCGNMPYDDDGRIIPPEVMAVMVNNARIVVPRDNSFKARLYDLRREVMAENKNPPDDDLPEILATLKDLTQFIEGLENVAARRRTERPKPGAVKALSDEAIAAAQASTGRVPAPAADMVEVKA